MRRAIDDARTVLERAVADKVFPSVVVEVGSSAHIIWEEALGTLTFDDRFRPARLQTPYDLASLTKPIVTATLSMELLRLGLLRLDRRVAEFFAEWRGLDREHVAVRDLLEHASGLAARLVDRPPERRREFEHEICSMPLEYPSRAKSLYSDLGFILLGFLLEDRGAATLAEQFAVVIARLEGRAASELAFELSAAARADAAPTLPMDDDPRRGRTLVAEVHDHYAAALGGAAGHAGLFGTARAVGDFARVALRASRGDRELAEPFSPALMAEYTARSTVPRSSRALAWDTMLPTSSCGTRMSPAAFGHVGFTGTSLWIDPERDRYFVLLANRACGGGSLDQMRDVRRAFHDALGTI